MAPSAHVPDALPLAPTVAPLGISVREAFDRVREMGFRHVQLSATADGVRPRDLDRSARRDLTAALRRRSLAPAGVDLWIPPAHFVEAARVDRAAEATREAIVLAADLGRCPVCLGLPRDGTGAPATPETVLAALREWAERHGVIVADHAVPVVEDPVFGVGIDPAAWLVGGDDPTASISGLAPRLASARLCDILVSGLRGPVGSAEGRLDVAAYRSALAAAGYRHPVVADARQWEDAWKGLAQTARAWVEGTKGLRN